MKNLRHAMRLFSEDNQYKIKDFLIDCISKFYTEKKFSPIREAKLSLACPESFRSQFDRILFLWHNNAPLLQDPNTKLDRQVLEIYGCKSKTQLCQEKFLLACWKKSEVLQGLKEK